MLHRPDDLDITVADRPTAPLDWIIRQGRTYRREVTHHADVRISRVYEERRPQDGVRILVDRLWPRGLRKDEARIDAWERDIAPSPSLRTWFGHDPERFAEFALRYEDELHDAQHAPALERLRAHRMLGGLTLVTATRDVECSHAAVIARLLTHEPA